MQLNIGMFSDTYLPQKNGVATAIKLYKDEMEKGDTMYIYLFQNINLTTKGTMIKFLNFRLLNSSLRKSRGLHYHFLQKFLKLKS